MFEIFSNTYVFDPSLCVEADRIVEKKAHFCQLTAPGKLKPTLKALKELQLSLVTSLYNQTAPAPTLIQGVDKHH